MTLFGLNVHPSFPFLGSHLSNLNSPLLNPFASLAPPPPPPPPPSMNKPNFVRITFSCGGYSPKSIKTDVYGNKVVISGREEARIDGENYSIKEFKRSYELPVNAEGERLASYMAPNGQLLIEVPLKHLPTTEEPAASVSPNNKKVMAAAHLDDPSNFSVTYQLPENIDPSRLNVTVRDHDLTIQTIDSVFNKSNRISDYSVRKIPINYLK